MSKPNGRPSKYKPDFAEKALKLCEQGCTSREVAEFFQVDEQTIRNWSHQHVEFFQALKLGRAASDDRVEQSLFRRAVGYQHDAVKILMTKDGNVYREEYVEHYPPDTVACIFWLKNRKPDAWRDKMEVEHTGTVALVEEMRAARERARLEHEPQRTN